MMRLNLKKIIAFIFIFDCAVLPVIKIMNLSFKISYIIGFFYAFLAIISMFGTKGSRFINESYYNYQQISRWLLGFTFLIILSEILIQVIAPVKGYDVLIKFLICIFLMFGSFAFGYSVELESKKSMGFLFYCLMINNVINCLLALLGRSTPAILQRIYYISLDTFTDGYYRNGGIIGNPNATLLIMNILFLLIIVLYSKDKIELNDIKLVCLFAFPLITDIVVSSRGELLQTILLDVYLIITVLRKNSNSKGHFVKLIFIGGLCVGVFSIVLNFYLIPRYPNIELSLQRLSELESIGNTGNDYLDTLMRPFYRWDKFSERFIVSPIWGTGMDSCIGVQNLIPDTSGFHNDFFLILASGGVLGLLYWIKIIRKSIKECGIIVIAPFITTAISNTFIQSRAAMMIFFFMVGVMICNGKKEMEQHEYGIFE